MAFLLNLDFNTKKKKKVLEKIVKKVLRYFDKKQIIAPLLSTQMTLLYVGEWS
jgi:hypothetical protein